MSILIDEERHIQRVIKLGCDICFIAADQGARIAFHAFCLPTTATYNVLNMELSSRGRRSEGGLSFLCGDQRGLRPLRRPLSPYFDTASCV